MILHYEFKQYETALTAFVGNVSNKINEIIENIPVFVLDNGDETFLMTKKYEDTKNKEIYLQNPRCEIVFGVPTIDKSQDTNQNIDIRYRTSDDEIYNVSATRKSLNFSTTLNLVCSNFVSSLMYFEIMQSLFIRENVLTYIFLGNNYPISYVMETATIERNEMDTTNAKNCIVKVELNLQLQPMIIRPQSIKSLGEINKKGMDSLDVNFDLVARYGDVKTTTPPDHEESFRVNQNLNV